MTLIAVDKNKSYDGPSSHHTIMMRLLQESKENGRELPINVIQSSVNSLFSYKSGIPYYINNRISASIKGFGRFLVTSHALNKYASKQKKKFKQSASYWRRRDKKRANHRRRIAQTLELLPVWEKKNEAFIARGWRPWTWRQFCSVIKETELIVYYKPVKAMIQKKIDDMNNGIFEKGDVVITKEGVKMIFFGNEGNEFCRICTKRNDNKPDMRIWGRKYAMQLYETKKLKPIIDIE